MREYGEQAGALARVANVSAWAAVRSGLAELLSRERVRMTARPGVPPQGIEGHLSGVLGEPIRVSMHLSAPRANRKPVLQALGRDGRTRAFVKVGISEFTRGLVDREAAALSEVGARGLRELTLPQVISHHTWAGLGLLVLSPLPRETTRVTDARRRDLAVDELTSSQRFEEELRHNSWWRELCARQRTLDQASGPRLRAATACLGQLAGETSLGFGPSHGDWTSWNTRVVAGTVLAWDWERYRPVAPAGFDVLHFALQERIVIDRRNAREAATTVIEDAPALLTRFVRSPAAARLTGLLYLADLGTRYLEDRQAEAGAALGRVDRWLLPTIEEATTRLSGRREGEPSC